MGRGTLGAAPALGGGRAEGAPAVAALYGAAPSVGLNACRDGVGWGLAGPGRRPPSRRRVGGGPGAPGPPRPAWPVPARAHRLPWPSPPPEPAVLTVAVGLASGSRCDVYRRQRSDTGRREGRKAWKTQKRRKKGSGRGKTGHGGRSRDDTRVV